METKYKIERYAYGKTGFISKVEIVKETAEFVVLPPSADPWSIRRKEVRERKDGHYFDSFEAAKAELVRRCEQAVQRANDERSRAMQKLQEARAFTLPESVTK